MDNFGDTPMLNDLLKEYNEGRLNESSSVPIEKAQEAGITLGEEPQPTISPEGNQVDIQGIEHNEEGTRQYQKLGFWETQADALKTLGAEALKFFAPEDGSKAAELLHYSESDLYQHQAQTKWSEALKYMYRYTADTITTSAVIAATGGALATPAIATKLPKLAKAGKLLQKLGWGSNLFKTSKTGAKLQAVKLANSVSSVGLGDAIASYTMYEEGEGHLADVLPQTKILDFLQTRSDDTEFEAKMKNVVENTLIGTGIARAVMHFAEPSVKSYYKAAHQVANATSEEGMAEALTDMTKAQINMEKFFKLNDRIDMVRGFKQQADETGEELSQLIIDNVPAEHQAEMLNMGKVLSEGEDIFQHSDGTWDIAVNNWEDAYKVTPEEYQKQLLAKDVQEGLNAGDNAINHQDKAVQSTWINRGWIGANEELNAKNANKIVKNYKDKFEIDNNIKVEFVDGLTVKGQSVEGNTRATKFLGKASKTKQNAIDKKTLQIQKLEDKITMLEGGNAPVTEELEVVKEELRIAKNELTELQKTVDKKNIRPDITIQIDKNSANPYAVLRSEIEHARDIAKGEVPKKADIEGSGEHFSRYVGDNEAEVASGYTHKKSTGRAKALASEGLQNDMNPSHLPENNVEYNQGDIINGQRTDTARTESERLATNRSSDRASLEGLSKSYERRSYNGSKGWLVETTHSLPNDIKTELNAQSIDTPDFHQLQTGNDEMATVFYNALKKAKELNPKKMASVDLHNPDDYKNMKMFLSENEDCGFVIKPDGDLISVFSYPEGSGRNKVLMPLALSQGAKKLDCYDTYLPKLYENYGFKEIKRDAWNEKYKPKEWDKKYFEQFNNGEPDVVYMALKEETTNISEPKQLSIFDQQINQASTTEDVVTAINRGTSLTEEEASNALSKVAEVDPEISGHTWEDICNDADDFYDRFFKDKTSEGYTALIEGDVDKVLHILRRQLAGEKVLSSLQDTLNTKLANGESAYDILKQMETITTAMKDIGSGAGRILQGQKLMHKVDDVFRGAGLSELSERGIIKFTDALEDIIQDLSFTRGKSLTPNQWRQLIYQHLETIDDGRFLGSLKGDKELLGVLNDTIDNAFQNNNSFDKSEFCKKIIETLKKEETEQKGLLVSLCNSGEKIAGVLSNFNQKVTTYAIANMLGLRTLAINVAGGGMMSLHSANRRLMAGLLERNSDGIQAGLHQYEGLILNWKDSMELAKAAFLKGDGLLTTTKQYFEGTLQQGLPQWELNAENILTVIPRAMMASDELLSQLNYRSIMRAKLLEETEKQLQGLKYTDEAFQNTFKSLWDSRVFNLEGKPLDVEAYTEAREVLFQTPLSKKMYDFRSGEEVPVGEKSIFSEAGSILQNTIAQHPALKILFPFVRTPFNIADTLHSNLPFSKAFYKKLTSNDLLVRSKAVGDLGITCMLGSGVVIASNLGMITGSPPIDRTERAALMRTGWQPYSIKVGDKFISYQGLAPFDGLLAMFADCTQLVDRITSDDAELDNSLGKCVQQFLASYIGDVADQTGYRDNMVKILDLIDPTASVDYKTRLLAEMGARFIPFNSAVKNVKTLGYHEEKQALTFWQRLMKNYLPLSMDYKRDCFGNISGVTNLWLTKVKDTDFDTPEYQAMADLAQHGWQPSELSKVIADYEFPLTEFKHKETGRSAYDYMLEEVSTLKIGGKTLREAVRDEVTSEDYQYLLYTDDNDVADTKKSRIQAIFQEYYEEARENILNNMSEEFIDSQGRGMEVSSEQIRNEKNIKALEKLKDLY